MSIQIVRIAAVPFHVVNAHLLISGPNAVLVDAGLPGFENKVEAALRRNGLDWGALKLIVVTHAHVDHAGGAARIHELSRAPIVAHRAELPYLRGEAPMTLCPTGWAGRAFYQLRLIHRRYRPVTPDVLLSGTERLDLSPFGFAGEVVTSGGHTAGAISVRLETGDALVGDLVASGVGLGGLMRLGRPIRPPFEEDPARVSVALGELLAAGANRFHVGHGAVLPAEAVRRHAELLQHQVSSDARPQRLPALRARPG